MELAMVNDNVVPLEKAVIGAHDRGIFFGDGVYEVVRSYAGRLFAMDRHLQRFARSLREMDMAGKVDVAVTEHRVERALQEAKIADAVVYFHVTRGQAPRAHDYGADWQPQFFLTVRSKPQNTEKLVAAVTHPDWRWKRCDIKSLNLLANVMAKHAATRAGAYEAILVDRDGLVTEASLASVLIVKDGQLWTAPLSANILPGITRAILLEQAGEVGLATREESFTAAQMREADELMITGTGTEVMGVSQVDGAQIGSGRLGEFTRRYQKILGQLTRG